MPSLIAEDRAFAERRNAILGRGYRFLLLGHLKGLFVGVLASFRVRTARMMFWSMSGTA